MYPPSGALALPSLWRRAAALQLLAALDVLYVFSAFTLGSW